MGIFDLFRGRNPTNQATDKNRLEMVTTYGEYFYKWNGKLYDSDVVRACIKPQIKAIGKLVGKHIVDSGNGNMKVNPEAYIKFLLAEPNPYMTAQIFQEKMAAQLALNNNAFALIIRDTNGYPEQLYPIPATLAEAVYDNNGHLSIKFTYKNGKFNTFPYEDLIHLRDDFCEGDVFGTSPAQALSQLMECVGVIDQGIVKAIKNSGMVRWLLKFTQSMRPEDVKMRTEEFVKNYLSFESDAFGAAGVDNKIDAKQIEPKDYVPNAAVTDKLMQRIYSFFGTNEKIVQSKWTEDEWNAYYESRVEPVAIQMATVYTMRLFSRRERAFGNTIIFEASNLQCASLTSKLNMVQMVDRGALTPNEWRKLLNLAPIEGGDEPIRRLDTAVVNMIETTLGKMDNTNYPAMVDLIKTMLNAVIAEGGERECREPILEE